MLNCHDCHNNYNPGDIVCPHCGSLLYDPQVTLMPGTLLQDRYEIQELFYVGSTFYIYITKDKKLYDRLCVIKQLQTVISSEPEKQQLEKAVLQTAQLSFPNVAMLLDHFIIDSFYYLVVEHIAGKKGSRTKYVTPSCNTLKTHSICVNMDDICKRIEHPIRYYVTKLKQLKDINE